MTSYEFYVCKYGGKAIQPDEWQTAYADADALIQRYERLYRVEYPTDSARDTAACAIADAQRRFAGAVRRFDHRVAAVLYNQRFTVVFLDIRCSLAEQQGHLFVFHCFSTHV